LKIWESKSNLLKIVKNILDVGFKVTILLLFVFMFIGRMNPARISAKMNTKISLVKSAFYFRSYVTDIVSLDSSSDDDSGLENPFAAGDGEIDYDDYYAQMAAMIAGNVAAQEAEESEISLFDESGFDDDSALSFDKAEKIKVINFKEVWSKFSNNHSEIAQALKFGQFASLFTFFSVILAVAGIYFACGTKIIRKIGYGIGLLGSVLVAISMINFNVAFEKLNSTMDMLDVQPKSPVGSGAFVAFAVLTIVFICGSLILECKFEKKPEDVQTSNFGTFNGTPFQYTYRLLALLMFVLLFIPAANPARISENINRNVSLFTSAVSYSTYTANLQRAIIRGWIPESITRIAWVFSIFACLGTLACGAGACMSIGNNKLKRIGHLSLFGGSTVAFLSQFGILRAYNMISSSPNGDRVLPLEPNTVVLYFILFGIIFACAAVSFVLTPAPEKDEKPHMDAPYQLFLMLLPFLILVFIFSYLPLWGWRYAFFDYSAGDVLSMENWVGLKWFRAPFENAATRSDILRVLRNTLIMSGLGISFSWLPMIFAVFLSEIKNSAARRVIQTLTTIPNFISWVLVYAIAFCIFGTEGFISSLMQKIGVWDQGKNMLMGDKLIWLKMWAWGTWKGLGWSAIMYIAAISGIDQQLYEAATVDGANRMQRIWHITLPELIPTYVVLLILSVSGILSNGMDQYLVFKNSTNAKPIEVLDLYVYQITFGRGSSGNIPFSTVVSMFKSLVSVILLFITNKISKWIRGNSIF